MAAVYNDDLDPSEQISAEEMIAAIIFEGIRAGRTDKVLRIDEMCADLGRDVLKAVLLKFRPDLFEPNVGQ